MQEVGERAQEDRREKFFSFASIRSTASKR